MDLIKFTSNLRSRKVKTPPFKLSVHVKNSLVRHRVKHSKIKFVSTQGYVISSMFTNLLFPQKIVERTNENKNPGRLMTANPRSL